MSIFKFIRFTIKSKPRLSINLSGYIVRSKTQSSQRSITFNLDTWMYCHGHHWRVGTYLYVEFCYLWKPNTDLDCIHGDIFLKVAKNYNSKIFWQDRLNEISLEIYLNMYINYCSIAFALLKKKLLRSNKNFLPIK